MCSIADIAADSYQLSIRKAYRQGVQGGKRLYAFHGSD